jgi:hypothetical protein
MINFNQKVWMKNLSQVQSSISSDKKLERDAARAKSSRVYDVEVQYANVRIKTMKDLAKCLQPKAPATNPGQGQRSRPIKSLQERIRNELRLKDKGYKIFRAHCNPNPSLQSNIPRKFAQKNADKADQGFITPTKPKKPNNQVDNPCVPHS